MNINAKNIYVFCRIYMYTMHTDYIHIIFSNKHFWESPQKKLVFQLDMNYYD